MEPSPQGTVSFNLNLYLMKKLKLILTLCAVTIAVIAAFATRETPTDRTSGGPYAEDPDSAGKSKLLQKNLIDSANFLHP
jgi:hypothetical protein